MKKSVLTVFISLLFAVVVSGQNFSYYGNLEIYGSSDWGDYDNDGDLDLIVSGHTYGGGDYELCIFKNNGTSLECDVNCGLTPVSGIAKWIDFNNDGILDVFTMGHSIDSVTGYPYRTNALYAGNGDGTFEKMPDNPAFLKWSELKMDCGDFNNDGLQDFALSGVDSLWQFKSAVFENQPDGFELSGFDFEGLIYGSLEWADYDRDMDLDLLVNGSTIDYGMPFEPDAFRTLVYRNDGDSLKKMPFNLQGTFSGSASWGDFDNDADPDILVTGYYIDGTNELYAFSIFENRGDDSFVLHETPDMPLLRYHKAAWGDMDNDGDLDVVVNAQRSVLDVDFTLIAYNFDGDFVPAYVISNDVSNEILLADYDNDSDLDVLTGSKLYINNSSDTNDPPSAPGQLSSETTGNNVKFSWNRSSDDLTPGKGLTYNIYIRSKPASGSYDSVFFMQPFADINTGFRKIPHTGNTGSDTSWVFFFSDTTINYEWSVQAIDNCYRGSEFAPPATLCFVAHAPEAITGQALNPVSNEIDLTGSVNPSCGTTTVYFEYGTDTLNWIRTSEILLNGGDFLAVEQHISGLNFNSLYYYRIVASNETALSKGGINMFLTGADGLNENRFDVRIYPNPSAGLFSYALKKPVAGHLIVFDIRGKRRATFELSKTQTSGSIDISHMEDGSYTAVFITGNGSGSLQLIKSSNK